jgi:hypothetical protein
MKEKTHNMQHTHTHTRVLANIGVPRNLKTLSSKKKGKKKNSKGGKNTILQRSRYFESNFSRAVESSQGGLCCVSAS